MQITNTTKQTVTLPTKDGKYVDIRAGQTETGDLDKDEPTVAGYVFAGAITLGATKAQQAAAASSAPAKPVKPAE